MMRREGTGGDERNWMYRWKERAVVELRRREF